jgi:hypothetical protein
MLLKPTALRFGSKLVPQQHHGKEEQQADVRIGVGASWTLGSWTGVLIGLESLAQEGHIVTKGGLGHGNTSFV